MRSPSLITAPSPNHDARALQVSMVVLHYTGMQSGAEALTRLCDAAAKVSAHYLIEEDGRIYALVPEERRAWHAGKGFWRGITDVNSASIGIELVNPGHEWGYRPFPEAQITALLTLLRGIAQRHAIPPLGYIAHSDLAPLRKTDPGELFPWARLAAAGFGLWPEPAPTTEPLLTLLKRIGYDISDADAAIRSFCRHFAPAYLDNPDEAALARLAAALDI